jgi:putative tryptophan/tyrosine transport system substrate-binding protein
MRPGVISRRQFAVGAGAASLGLLAGCGRLSLPALSPPRSAAKVPRIGALWPVSADDGLRRGEDFRRGLSELGYVEGRTIEIEWRFGDGDLARLPALASELIALPVDIIVANSDPAVQAVKQQTDVIPIVMAVVGDPVGPGFVTSLAHPGGNVTGLTNLASGLTGKRLELLRDAIPNLARVAVLRNPGIPTHMIFWRETQAAANELGLAAQAVDFRGAEDFDSAFQAAADNHADAVMVFPEPVAPMHRARVVALAAALRLPTIYALREFVDAGGLMSYGPSHPALVHRAAYYVDRILKGAKPADLPVEQPMTFDFVVNLKTARALGITFPNEILLQVTEVIE